MKNSEINNTGIGSYLTAQKLFNKQRHNNTSSSKKNIQSQIVPQFGYKPYISNTKKNKYQYYLLSDLKQKEMQQSYRPNKTINHFEIKEEFNEQSRQRIPNLTSEDENHYDQQYDNQIQTQKPAFPKQKNHTMESIVIKTSRKYFQACRSEALDFIGKMQTILAEDRDTLSNQIKNIRYYIGDNHQRQAQKLKQQLYKAVDEAIQKWKEFSIKQFNRQQINYMGDLFELSTQVEQRIQQMREYRKQIADEHNWKKRASDLLIANYEQNIIELSNLCKSSAYTSNENAKKWMITKNEQFSAKIQKLQNNSFQKDICSLIKKSLYPKRQDLLKQDSLRKQANVREANNTKYMRETQTKIKNYRKQIFDSSRKTPKIANNYNRSINGQHQIQMENCYFPYENQ